MGEASQWTDVVLDCEGGEEACYYRVGRLSQHCYHVVYITVKDLDVLMPDIWLRMARPYVLRHLKTYPKWEDHGWRTMEARLRDGQVVVELDREPVHFVDGNDLLPDMPRYDIFRLGNQVHLSPYMALRASTGGQSVVLKIAPYKYLLRHFVSRELFIYHAFISRRTAPMPKLLGYVYEEHPSRVIGFMIEDIRGVHPGSQHRPQCEKALRALHAQGLYHGDINNYNMIVTPSGEVIFIDFENSTLATSEEEKQLMADALQAEVEILANLPLKETAELRSPVYTVFSPTDDRASLSGSEVDESPVPDPSMPVSAGLPTDSA